MDYSTLDDDTVIKLVVQAQTDALGELYDRYGRLVYSLAFGSTGDRAAAEEITQDVFLRVWQRASQYQADRGKVSTWITGIARNRTIDQFRRRASRPEQHSIPWEEIRPGTEPAANGPAQAAELKIERQRVCDALAELPTAQKEVLALAYFKGLTQDQIAEALGLPLGTVKTRVRLGMQKLRERLVE
jgi:RNA polymerase sigma-70 factor (ECF subfamily)